MLLLQHASSLTMLARTTLQNIYDTANPDGTSSETSNASAHFGDPEVSRRISLTLHLGTILKTVNEVVALTDLGRTAFKKPVKEGYDLICLDLCPGPDGGVSEAGEAMGPQLKELGEHGGGMRIIATIMLLMALASEYEPLGVKLQKGEKNSYDAQVRTQWSHMSYGSNCMAALVTLHEDKLICFPELQPGARRVSLGAHRKRALLVRCAQRKRPLLLPVDFNHSVLVPVCLTSNVQRASWAI